MFITPSRVQVMDVAMLGSWVLVARHAVTLRSYRSILLQFAKKSSFLSEKGVSLNKSLHFELRRSREFSNVA